MYLRACGCAPYCRPWSGPYRARRPTIARSARSSSGGATRAGSRPPPRGVAGRLQLLSARLSGPLTPTRSATMTRAHRRRLDEPHDGAHPILQDLGEHRARAHGYRRPRSLSSASSHRAGGGDVLGTRMTAGAGQGATLPVIRSTRNGLPAIGRLDPPPSEARGCPRKRWCPDEGVPDAPVGPLVQLPVNPQHPVRRRSARHPPVQHSREPRRSAFEIASSRSGRFRHRDPPW